jgi:hypothetical protein
MRNKFEKIGVVDYDKNQFSSLIAYQYTFSLPDGMSGVMADIAYGFEMFKLSKKNENWTFGDLMTSNPTATLEDCKKELISLLTEQFRIELDKYIDSMKNGE